MSDPFRDFAARMAQFTTPYDADQVDIFLREYPQFKGDPDLESEIYAEYPSDNAIEEASVFWQMIKEARALIASYPDPTHVDQPDAT